MSLPQLSGVARLIDDPELRYAASGSAVVKVRLAFNSRKKDQAGQWVDDATFFVRGTAFGQSAENIAASLQRGMEVMVTGRMKTESWEKDGEKRSEAALLIDGIGPSLRFATARVEKTGGQGGGRQEFQQARQAQGAASAEDPWSSAPGQQAGGWNDEAPPF